MGKCRLIVSELDNRIYDVRVGKDGRPVMDSKVDRTDEVMCVLVMHLDRETKSGADGMRFSFPEGTLSFVKKK